MANIQFDIITIFPNILDSYLSESILGRAQKNNLISIKTHDLREWTTDKHRTVDDTPYGGGVGMVMMVEPIQKAIMSLRESGSDRSNPANQRNDDEIASPSARNDRVILLSPRGKRFTQQDAARLTQYEQLVFVCGRYEGVDHRVTEYVDEEISIGDFILNGGELPALMVTEAVSRLLPGVLGKNESSQEESFSDEETTEYPQYTRPETFTDEKGKSHTVPEVLLSGNHQAIADWRKKQRKKPNNT